LPGSPWWSQARSFPRIGALSGLHGLLAAMAGRRAATRRRSSS
jgi:hypothetical protein